MKKNKYVEWRDSRDKKYREKHGDTKFLYRVSKDFFFALVFIIIMFLIAPLLLFIGIWWVWSPTANLIFFIAGIMLFSLSCFMFLGGVLMLFLLPFHKRRSKEAKIELQLLLKQKESHSLAHNSLFGGRGQHVTECTEHETMGMSQDLPTEDVENSIENLDLPNDTQA